jgi:Flp pilus assembly protein TadD
MAEKWVLHHPKDVSVITYLAQRDIAEKRYAEAEKRYALALQRDPNNPFVLNNLAWVSFELKQPKALAYAERANEIAPNTPEIMDTLGWMLTQSGERERGVELLARASEMAPQAHAIRLNLAKALVKAGRKDAARKELEVLAKLDSKLPVQREASALLANL